LTRWLAWNHTFFEHAKEALVEILFFFPIVLQKKQNKTKQNKQNRFEGVLLPPG